MANHGAGDWHAVRGPSVVGIAAVIIVGAVVGTLCAWLAAGAGPVVPAPARTPALDLRPGERAVWVSSSRNRIFVYVAAVVGGVGVIGGIVRSPIAFVAVLFALTLAAFAVLHVQADRSGLTIHYGPLPFPRTHIDVADIASAEAIDIRPLKWGGWGYRGSLRMTRRAAVVNRGGPGLKLTMNDGRQFAVTVDDPETGAALLNAVAP